jgi:GT2 family glycosyltransferase
MPVHPDDRDPQVLGSTSSDVSVIVCTRDRADDLERCLAALARLRVPAGISAEVVVVDNASTDRTPDVIAAARERGPLPVRRVYLAQPGLARARNAGMTTARGELLLFTDDDCLPDPDWLEAAQAVMRGDPSLGIVGGLVRLHDPRDLPETIKTWPRRETPRRTADLHALLLGANMAVRRSALAAVGPFDSRFGAGARFKSAEDTDMIYRLYRAGYGVRYDPAFAVSHNHGRRDLAGIRRLHRGYRIGRGAFYAKHLLLGRFDVLAILGRQLVPLRRTAYPMPSWPRYLRGVLGQFARMPWLCAGALAYWREAGSHRQREAA